MASSPLSLREALISQALADVDGLVRRVEALHQLGPELEAMTTALREAASQYREAVASFTDGAKDQLTVHVQSKARETLETVRAEVATTAKTTFSKEGSAQAQLIAAAVASAVREARPPIWHRAVELGIACATSSAVTGGLIYWLMR